MSIFFFYILIPVAAIISSSCCKASPTNNLSSSPLCKIKDGHINECLKTYFQEAIKHSAQGRLIVLRSSQYSIPSMDPYFVPKIMMSPSKNAAVNIEMTNALTYGFSSAVLKSVKAEPAKGFFEINYLVPVSTILSNYNLTGKVFSIPINGQGKSNVSFYDVFHEMKIQGSVVNKDDGNKYFEISSVKIHIKPKKMIFRFEKLFKDNNELGEVVNQMMNDNWLDIFVRLQPKMEEDMSKHAFQLLNNFFKKVPYNKIFPGV